MGEYYREWFDNSPANSVRVTTYANGRVDTAITAGSKDSVEMISWRDKPHPRRKGGYFEPVLDIDADPYAGFLRASARRRDSSAQKSRGIYREPIVDTGHAFASVRRRVDAIPGDMDFFRVAAGQTIKDTNFLFPGNPETSNGQTFRSVDGSGYKPHSGLAAFGQLAYNRVAPDYEVFDGAQAIGEAIQQLPNLPGNALRKAIGLKKRANAFKGVADEYINIEFGWKPFVRDIMDLGRALHNATLELAKQGERIHRSFSVPEEVYHDLSSWSRSRSTSLTTIGTLVPRHLHPEATNSGSAFGARNISLQTHRRLIKNRWFKGLFSVYLPLGFDPTSYLDRLKVLMNLEMKPSVWWEITPWSWLLDWAWKIQDSIEAAQKASDEKLVMHYGYAMETAHLRNVVTVAPSGASVLDGRSRTYILSTEYKTRVRANPYGFRVQNFSGFDPRQISILAALGISKS